MLEAGFSHWERTGELLPQMLAESAPYGFVEKVDAGASTSPARILFVSTLILARGDIDASSRLFARAFAACPALMDCVLAEQLDSTADAMSPSFSLASIMKSENPADGIKRVLLHRQSTSERIAREYAAHVSRVQDAPPCTIQQATQYCYAKIVEQEMAGGQEISNGTKYLTHKALFWALAGWAHWKHAALTPALPKHKPMGPWFAETSNVLKEICEGAVLPVDPIREADVLRVLDASIAHVCRLGWQAACEETHYEPLWIITPDDQPMSTVVKVYSSRDVTGAIHRIFPWLRTESLEQQSPAAGGCTAVAVSSSVATKSSTGGPASGIIEPGDAVRGSTASGALAGSKRLRDSASGSGDGSDE